MMGWQWHQQDHMQITCTSLQTDNHANISPRQFFTTWMPFLPPNQQRQSTEGHPQKGITKKQKVKENGSKGLGPEFVSNMDPHLLIRRCMSQTVQGRCDCTKDCCQRDYFRSTN